jgi:uncharacterized coiled-coil DUF342 family protein
MRDQHANKGSGATKTAASTTTAQTRNREDVLSSRQPSTDSNLKTLSDFKKNLLEEKRTGEETIENLNKKIEDTKRHIDDERISLDELRAKLKEVNEQKDAEFSKYTELKNALIEARTQMKSLDEKVPASRSRKDRYDLVNLNHQLDQIERDIQTKKLSKDEERRLVLKSKEVATKLYALKAIHKKEDRYRTISLQYDLLKNKMNKLFDQKSELGEGIGKIKSELDDLLNLRESLYEDRRRNIRNLREADAKLEMVDTQLNAILFKRTRASSGDQRNRKYQRGEGKKDSKYVASLEKVRRSKENQDRWNLLKEAALKKMSGGEKLTFEEMKLIYGESGSSD